MQVALYDVSRRQSPPRRSASTDSVKAYLQDIGRIPLLTAQDEITLGQQVQLMMALFQAKTTLAKQLGRPPSDREWATAAQLTKAEIRAILHQGQQAKRRMMEANLRLVVAVAKKYQGRDLELLDLIQEGSIGLERAVEKFDPSRGYKFSTYAYWWIRQGITRAIAEQARTIRLPIHVTEKLNKIKRTQRELSQALGHTPTLAEVAQHLDLPLQQVKDCLQAARQPLSLDMRIGDNQDTELQDLLEDSHTSPDGNVTQQLLKQDIQHLLEQLSPLQQDVIVLRYGLRDGRELSLAKVGERLGISRERVRQLQQEALKRLRLRKDSIRGYLVE